ncbi:hypothetical protein KJ966_03375 [bacterium]|nr:hypothetical protein [bacterium]
MHMVKFPVFFIGLKQLLMIIPMVFLIAGCGFEHCKQNPRYADKAGICGKIYRVEQARKRLEQSNSITLIIFLAIMLLPIVIIILYRIIRFFLNRIICIIKDL